jgi:hypothetical protein
MGPGKFILMDGLAAVISIPFNTILVYYLGADIENLLLTLRRVNWTLILILCLTCLIWILYQQKKIGCCPPLKDLPQAATEPSVGSITVTAPVYDLAVLEGTWNAGL